MEAKCLMTSLLWMKTKNLPAWICIAALLISWQIAAIRVNHPALFPSVTQLIESVFLLLGTASFYESLLFTVLRGFLAFITAILLALPASVIAHHFPFWKSFFQPLIVVMRSIPVIAIVLIALLFLSPLQLPLIIGCVTMFPIIYQNLVSAWDLTDTKLIEMAVLYRKTIVQRFRYIYFLQSKDMLIAGMATATGFGWRAIIIGEVLSGTVSGIGTAMKKSQAYIDMPGLLGWTLVAIGGGFLIEWLWKKMNCVNFRSGLKIIKSTPTPEQKGNPELNIEHLSFSYTDKLLFTNFTLKAKAGTVYQLKTASGSGKTTLLKLIAGILRPISGKVERKNICSTGFSFQDLRLVPMLSVEQNIAFSLAGYPNLLPAQQQKLEYLIQQTHLTDHRSKLPGELSGGEQQRVNLARALITEPDLLLLDEPLTGLDSGLKKQIQQLIQNEIALFNPVVIWATHESTDEWTLPVQNVNLKQKSV